ncbi:CDP-alcohol phosphatidyltransferase family protein [Alphaproteobacteria bacterium HT1-32]|nr:CDP-alcohol phosphatidyltransferase family protein [Alphaproteobacteria bacterium HT1-32]
MLDARIRPYIDRPLALAAEILVARKISANTVTLAGFFIGLAAVPAIAAGAYPLALTLILINRLSDGLDGAVARLTGKTDLGGYLDIVCDFIFYSAIIFGFALASPGNSLSAAFLIFSFMGTGSSFLTFAIMAEKRGITTDIRGSKSLYYLGGLTEGTETIALFVAICLWPEYFPVLAWAFGALCWVTTISRIIAARQTFGDAG